MINRETDLPVTTQCELLEVARSTVYYQSCPCADGEIDLMRRIDEIHLRHPFLGSRRIVDALGDDGIFVNRKRVQRLMRIMGIVALYPRRSTSVPAPGHKIYPYLLRGLTIDRPNQVWCTDVERHEAFLNLAVVKGHRFLCVAAHGLEAEGSLNRETPGWVEAALTTTGRVGTVRRSGSG